jgi:hypothetical protein
MNDMYILIFYLYFEILYFLVMLFLGGYYPRFFFTWVAVGMGQNVYPCAGAGAGAGGG